MDDVLSFKFWLLYQRKFFVQGVKAGGLQNLEERQPFSIILSTYTFNKMLNTFNFCKFNLHLIKLQGFGNGKRLEDR